MFWLGYITNGKHLSWYVSVQYTLAAMVFGGAVALLVGLLAAPLHATTALSRFAGSPPATSTSSAASRTCCSSCSSRSPSSRASNGSVRCRSARPQTLPPTPAAGRPAPPPTRFLGTSEYLILACVSLGIVYGAFVANVIAGATARRSAGPARSGARLRHEPHAGAAARPYPPDVGLCAARPLQRLDAARSRRPRCCRCCRSPTSCLGRRLGAPNFSRSAGLVHADWRWRYYLVLLVFYILRDLRFREGLRGGLNRWASRGMPLAERRLMDAPHAASSTTSASWPRRRCSTSISPSPRSRSALCLRDLPCARQGSTEPADLNG